MRTLHRRHPHAFTLLELLVVIAIIALLLTILLPSLRRAREQAKVTVVNAELRQIGMAIETYMTEKNGRHPPTRKDCSMGWEDHQLPPELAEGGYLPAPADGSGLSVDMHDRFNPGHTYKYSAVGELYQNNRYMHLLKSQLWIPDGFPAVNDPNAPGQYYSDPATAPVTWVVYSHGPDFDWADMQAHHYPVHPQTWYAPAKRRGVIVRLRLRNSNHIGTFDASYR